MSEFLALSFDALLTRLVRPANTLILFHRNPDADAVGSAFALKKVLTDLGSRVFCVCESEIPARLLFLTDGQEQESVLPQAIPADFALERIVSVDTASPAQLGALYALYAGKIDLMIDHHGMGEPYADHYIRPDAAATGEILFDIVKHLATAGRVKITQSLCTAIYGAISADTGGFRFQNVTADTHLRAAELMASGIDCAEINHRLFDSFSMERSASVSPVRRAYSAFPCAPPASWTSRPCAPPLAAAGTKKPPAAPLPPLIWRRPCAPSFRCLSRENTRVDVGRSLFRKNLNKAPPAWEML